ncbi:MAG: VOC family protein [Gammaproteobacteria bacterium]|nr:VOC family protein [Gammaproteobacteria bacterium]MBQ0840703.1 VOC family protein [Gammaproteobacteria bacterium]
MQNPAREKTTSALTQGVHDIGLTVPNLHQTKDFFMEVLGFKQVGEKPEYPAVFVSDGEIMITLWQAVNVESVTEFDRRNNIGLHHLALAVVDIPRLNELHKRLREIDSVAIEFPPEPLGGGPTQHMMCAIPGGIRVEFIARG